MTGLERFDPKISGEIKYEHYHRYALACEYARGLNVLDIACGVGYGSHMLGQFANKVVGIDLSEDAITEAKITYSRPDNIEFMVGEATEIAFSDQTFDLIVSFETIEHLENPKKFMQELKRVLKKDGLLIISSPEKNIYNQNRKESNEFHLNELTLEEFSKIVSDDFSNSAIFGQNMIIASAVSPLNISNPIKPSGYIAYTVIEDSTSGPVCKSEIAQFFDPTYLLCFASDKSLPDVKNSMFIMSSINLWNEHSKVMNWASLFHDETEKLRLEISELNAKLLKEKDLTIIASELKNIINIPIQANVSDIINGFDIISMRLDTNQKNQIQHKNIL